MWELSRPCFSLNDRSDGGRDKDGDGMSNRAEYLAGTNFLDPNNYLKLEVIISQNTIIQFTASSNHSYNLQFTDDLKQAQWQNLRDFFARTNSRIEQFMDPNPITNRFLPVGDAVIWVESTLCWIA